ncbi:TPA: hypothetical protein ROX98_000861 [Bacillus pseudomycoides]|nr:hypothetical protein [Bacillus pseudomycoides]
MNIFERREQVLIKRKKEVFAEYMEVDVDRIVLLNDEMDRFTFDVFEDIALTRIIHESEFLKFVVEQLNSSFVLRCGFDEFEGAVEPSFFAKVTGISEDVFSLLIKAGASDSIKSIVERTVGVFDFAQKALDYYGIGRFANFYMTDEPYLITEDGFYLYTLC